jgi:hypothetical protein
LLERLFAIRKGVYEILAGVGQLIVGSLVEESLRLRVCNVEPKIRRIEISVRLHEHAA